MPRIGELNETDLHEQLKHEYAAGGATEVTVDGWVVDVVAGGELVEIQTGAFLKLRRKLAALSEGHRIRIVHPIPERTLINRLGADGTLRSSRRSPRRGRYEDVYRHLVSIADLLPSERITVEALLVTVVETRVEDGKGSWRRKGVSVVSRSLADVVSRRELRSASDYLAVLPKGLPREFTNADLQEAAALRYRLAQPVTSALRRMGLIEICGRRGRQHVYRRTSSARPKRL